MVSVVIHTNMALPNQTESAGWLQTGFASHGIDAEITGDKHKAADIHVVQGPWYAFNEWLGKDNVLWLDRCFYGDARFDLSIGWLQPDGSRKFCNHGMARAKGTLPALKPRKGKRRCAVVFADYGQDCTQTVIETRQAYDSVFFRPHPAQAQETPVITLKGDLANVWEIADVAIGHSSTVLVEAEINGLHVETTDARHVARNVTDRTQWLNDLSWAQWNHEEIQRGEFWEHLH